MQSLTVTVTTKAFALTIAITCLLGSDAQGQESMKYLTTDQHGYETTYGPMPVASPPHFVLEPPKMRRHGHLGSLQGDVVAEPGQNPSAGAAEQTGILPHEKVAEHILHANKTPRAVPIPGATRAPLWKTPYSYGHFGARRNRQWTQHHGYQNDYTQWTLR